MEQEPGRTFVPEGLGWDEAERLRLLTTENERLRSHLLRLENRRLAQAQRRVRRIRWQVARALSRVRGQRLTSFHGLFDDGYYLSANPDVAAHGTDPLVHYLAIGWREGRDPNPLFDTDWYASQHRLDRLVNPLLNYVDEGAARGLDPSPWFSTVWYTSHAQVPDHVTPLAHYLATGGASRISPSPHFDAGAYLDENPDVAAAGVNPLAHYLSVGRYEGRAVHPIRLDGPGRVEDPELPELQVFLGRYAPSLALGIAASPQQAECSPFMSVVIRTQGRRLGPLGETLLCLVAQDCDDFEVVLVAHDATRDAYECLERMVGEFRNLAPVPIMLRASTGGTRGRPLLEGMQVASGRYCVVLDDDDHVTADWISSFAAAEKVRPGSVLRCRAVSRRTALVDRPAGPVRVASGTTTADYCSTWSLREHIRVNGTPVHAYATPSWIRTELGAVIDEHLSVVEDWDYLIRSAMVCGVTDSGDVTALYNRGGQDSEATVPRSDWRSLEDAVRAATLTKPVLDRWLT